MGGELIRGFPRPIRIGAGADSFSSASTPNVSRPNSRKAKQINYLRTSSSNTALTLSSSSSTDSIHLPLSSLINFPVSPASGGAYAPPWDYASSIGEESSDWEHIDDAIEEEQDLVFRAPPTTIEVEQAVSALQQVDWVEPSPYLSNSRKVLQPYGSSVGVMDAFHLLQTEPAVQRMVVSLSSDKAVWDAVMNNEAVRDLRGSISQAASLRGEDVEELKDNDSRPYKDILSWIAVHAKTKIAQLVEKIVMSLNHLFQLAQKDGIKVEGSNTFQEKQKFEETVKTSLVLSVVVLLVVVATRIRNSK